jgi:hypothetical protein
LILICLFGQGTLAGSEGRTRLEWPSREFPTLQDAVEAAADGALITIRPGIHHIREPIVIAKRLRIAGAESGRRPVGRTVLVGPPPRRVVDERGNVVLRAEAARGMFTVLGARLAIRNLVITGFDAAIVAKDERGEAASAHAADLVIARTGRGILSLASGQLAVEKTDIISTLWHAISVKPPVAIPNTSLSVDQTNIYQPLCAGIYFSNTTAVLTNVTVSGALCGAIVGFRSKALIFDSLLMDNQYAGIVLVEADSPLIRGNSITGTLKNNLQLGGDGISLFLSTGAFLDENAIHYSVRAGVGVYASPAGLVDNTITCSGFDIDYEAHDGMPAVIPTDLGGNLCGCGVPLGECSAVSSVLAPTPPIDTP